MRYGEPKWPWSAFGTYLAGKSYVTSGKAVAIENGAQFQNGFGAIQHYDVRCSYDLEAGTVTDILITAAG